MVRAALVWIVAIAFTSCSEDFAFDSKCSRILTLTCERYVACGFEANQFACEESLRESVYCDETRSLEELDACIEAIKAEQTDVCILGLPEDCQRVLCNVGEPCGEDQDVGDLCLDEGIECPKTADTGITPGDSADTGASTGDTGPR